MAGTPSILTGRNVLEAARRRMAWIYVEFERPVVNFSGGKDSTALLELSIEAAREAGKSPVTVSFIDQETLPVATVEHVRATAERPDVRMHWAQFPYGTLSPVAKGHGDQVFRPWDEAAKERWMRPKEPGAVWTRPADVPPDMGIAETVDAIAAMLGDVTLTGVRATEGVDRRFGMTTHPVHKWVTWGSKPRPGGTANVTLSPIWDWQNSDVWKAIFDHGWAVNDHYRQLWQHGVDLNHRESRVSSLVSENGTPSIDRIAELEPDTWHRLLDRIPAAHSERIFTASPTMAVPKTPPAWFESWEDYRHELLMTLLADNPVARWHLVKEWSQPSYDERFSEQPWRDKWFRRCCSCVVQNTWETKVKRHWLRLELIRRKAMNDDRRAKEAHATR